MGAGADLRRRRRRAAAVRPDAHPGADRAHHRARLRQPLGGPGRRAGHGRDPGHRGRRRGPHRLDRPGRPSSAAPPAVGASLFRSWVLPFEALSVLLLAALVGAIVLSRPDGAAPTPTRPRRPAPAHRAGGARADAPRLPRRPRRAAVRHRRLRRARPAQRGPRADGRRADAQRRQPQPRRLLRLAARQRCIGQVSPSSSSPSPPPRSAWAWPSSCWSSATAAPRPSTTPASSARTRPRPNASRTKPTPDRPRAGAATPQRTARPQAVDRTTHPPRSGPRSCPARSPPPPSRRSRCPAAAPRAVPPAGGPAVAAAPSHPRRPVGHGTGAAPGRRHRSPRPAAPTSRSAPASTASPRWSPSWSAWSPLCVQIYSMAYLRTTRATPPTPRWSRCSPPRCCSSSTPAT